MRLKWVNMGVNPFWKTQLVKNGQKYGSSSCRHAKKRTGCVLRDNCGRNGRALHTRHFLMHASIRISSWVPPCVVGCYPI